VRVREKLSANSAAEAAVDAAPAAARRTGSAVRTVVIVGGGAAGLAAAASLRRHGFQGALTMISADDSPPCDRPNLSKDYLLGTAPAEWIPLRTPQFYAEQRIDLVLDSPVTSLDLERHQVQVAGGKQFAFDSLLLATGAAPVRLDIPGAAAAQLCYLRSFADSRVILAKAANAQRVVVVGASFIGLEVAASLCKRGIEVHVVGPEKVPMARVLGEPAGKFIQQLHESQGVRFHLGNSVKQANGRQITLSDGTRCRCGFPGDGRRRAARITLAEKSGLATDRGVSVNEYLETSAPGVFRRR
jgi:NADPH-dependent 2,4-dienoyl-CoA reductase/sulfur reductase-like enzyme